MIAYPLPDHANTLPSLLGGITLSGFIILILTGILLAQFYNPDPAAALPALAHGDAALTVTPSQAEPGAQITLQTDGVEPGEVFTIRLEGLSNLVVLGEVPVAEGEDGFSAVFDRPVDLLPGPYQVTATSEEGESLSAELSVLPAAGEPGADGVREPSAAPMELDRSGTPLQVGLIITALLASATLGVVPIRRRA